MVRQPFIVIAGQGKGSLGKTGRIARAQGRKGKPAMEFVSEREAR